MLLCVCLCDWFVFIAAVPCDNVICCFVFVCVTISLFVHSDIDGLSHCLVVSSGIGA